MSVGGYAEIVKALRLCSAVNSSCEECPCNDPADDLCECANKVGIAAADAIENLLTENAALRRMIGNLTDEKAALVKELHDSKSELSAAIAGQETLQKAMAKQCWVSTNDRLPEPKEKAICINRHLDYMIGTYTEWGWMFPCYYEKPTHWMPLPEKAKED